MPIVNFHLVEGAHEDANIGALLVEANQFYVETQYPGMSPAPIERVRAFVSGIRPQYWATAGRLACDGGADAPFFTCLALSGRPVEQPQRLLAGFTDLIVKHLGCDRRQIRGQVIEIDPAHWIIGGEAASVVRSGEVGLRTGKA